jgi:hypothetical protein
MATTWEQKQALIRAQAKQRATVRSAAGAATDIGVQLAVEGSAASLAPGLGWAAAINFIGNLGIGAYQFFSQKKDKKKKERSTRKKTQTQEGVEGVLSLIKQTGDEVVNQGVDPTTEKFEQVMFKVLYPQIGYRGNCNIIARHPGTGEKGPVWFTVTGNGRIFKPHNMQGVPANIQTYWNTNCRGFRHHWANTYQDLLLEQGRFEELEDFKMAHASGIKYMRISFGILFAILLIVAIRYGVKIR